MKNKKTDILKKYKLLYVEDHTDIAEEMSLFLEPLFKCFSYASDGKKALESFQDDRPDIIITDIQMPNMNGIAMIEKIREIDTEIPIIITTAFNESDYLLKAINLQVDAYVMKPLNIKALIEKLLKVLEPIELKRVLISKNEELENINQNLETFAREKTKELEHIYNHDPLTGLPNFINLGIEIETQKYEYLILLDISNFSIINKQYGKDFSNKILQVVARKLENNINKKQKLFKIESDRFVILCQAKEKSFIKGFVNQIISFFDTQKTLVDDLEINITFSIGIANIEKDTFPLVDAEFALDISKQLGSRYYHFFDTDTDSVVKIKENIKWLNATKEMIDTDSIVPYFQPISDIQTGEIIKYEVLARGEHEGEIILPFYFINQAERLGLLNSITRMIINKSFKYLQDTEVDFSINITERDILDKQFISFLEDRLTKFHIQPSRITFEVLENVTTMRESKFVISQLKTLKYMGFKLAIDDFGAENANFSRFVDIDFDYIKLDGIFLQELIRNKKEQVVIMGIVSLAKTLGIKTIAEFVETEELYEIIKKCGVSMAQGHYIGKPLATILECEKC